MGITASHPTYHPLTGKLLGIVAADYEIKALDTYLQSTYKRSSKFEVVFIDGHEHGEDPGVLLGSSLSENLYRDDAKVKSVDSTSPVVREIARLLADKANSEESNSGTDEPAGARGGGVAFMSRRKVYEHRALGVLISTTRFNNGKGIDWNIVTVVPLVDDGTVAVAVLASVGGVLLAVLLAVGARFLVLGWKKKRALEEESARKFRDMYEHVH